LISSLIFNSNRILLIHFHYLFIIRIFIINSLFLISIIQVAKFSNFILFIGYIFFTIWFNFIFVLFKKVNILFVRFTISIWICFFIAMCYGLMNIMLIVTLLCLKYIHSIFLSLFLYLLLLLFGFKTFLWFRLL
jgi:hypothetical protein